MANNSAISVSGLSKSFKTLKVLDNVSFAVEKGTVLALLGPNGAGKTTTIRILSTLLMPDKGNVLVNGFDVLAAPNQVRSAIGLTGQYSALDEYLTGFENLVMIGRLYHLETNDAKSKAKTMLTKFDLVDAANRPVKTYSGGMQRRLDLAASLIASPPILFLDEPTTGLDPRSRLTMWKIIKEFVSGGTTILLTTQHLEEADNLADKIVVLDVGKVIAQGTADQLKQKVGNERIELTIQNEADFEKAQKAIGEKSTKSDIKRKTISIATKGGVVHLKKILDRLEKAKVTVEGLSLHKPTLDDVFLTLTGHQAQKESNEDEK